MKQISVYIEFLEYLRVFGLKTIEKIKSMDAWSYRVSETEFSINQTFYHTIQAIFEDAGNWFHKDSKKFSKSDDPQNDLNLSIDRMILAVQDFDEEKLSEELRERIGIFERNS